MKYFVGVVLVITVIILKTKTRLSFTKPIDLW